MPKVSVLMPCHNASTWVAQAVESCLHQQVEVEIIAVDDGSTDGTGEVLRSFGPPVTVLSGPRQGAPTARNIAYEASTAPFIQYLDADDVILPGKFRAQLSFLKMTSVDAVYGDWRYCFEEGRSHRLGPIQRTGPQHDPVEALLDDWWMPAMVPLYRREAVAASGGWDPSISVGQDHDFLLSVVIAGGRLAYQPGCHSLYRRHSTVTVSRADPVQWLAGRVAVLEKAERTLHRADALASQRVASLAQSYLRLARWWWEHDREEARRLYARARDIHPDLKPDASLWYRALLALAGFDRAEEVALVRRRTMQRLRPSDAVTHPLPGR
jgi:glycosyltransferase involved in cell wall biosynthesis